MDRIKYVDALKFIAIFSIVLLHVSSIWNDIGCLGLTFDNLNEFTIFGVPLFIMVTGMLTLNREIDLEIFFKKKFVRIVYPLVFFFIIAYVLNIFSDFLTAYWYCWMIIAVYLAIPIINIFIKSASERDLEYFILMFIITSMVYSLAKTIGVQIALDMDFFIGPTAYLILGYYLSRKDFNISPNKMVLISLTLFLIISVIKVHFMGRTYINSNNIVYSWLNIDILQIIQTVSVFLLFRYLYSSSKGISHKIRNVLESDTINNLIISVSRSAYGIYLLHLTLLRGYIEPYFKNIHLTGFNTFISIWIISITLFLISWIVILILGRIPIINRLSGYY